MTTSGGKDWWPAGGSPYNTAAPYYSPSPLQGTTCFPSQPTTWLGTDSELHINTGRSVCVALGHQATETEWSEDEIVSYCSQCGEKFRVMKMPGGAIVTRIKFVLELLLAASEVPMAFNPLNDIAVLTEDLERDFEALEKAQKLLDIAKQIIKNQYESGTTDGAKISSTEPSSLD